ncbi:MAG: DUF1592 domain-containing protein [Pirellulaceae bacterium]
MSNQLTNLICTVCLSLLAFAAPLCAKDAKVDFEKEIKPIFVTYCGHCHGSETMEAGLRTDDAASSLDVLENSKKWKKILEMLEFGVMPPEGEEKPTAEERTKVIGYLESTLYDIDCKEVKDPGRVTIRRLNRLEYNNTIRDLLGLDLDLAAGFPSDDVGEGFDNIGDVLTLPPLLFEKYMDAAEKVAASAILDFDPESPPSKKVPQSDLLLKGAAQRGAQIVFASVGEAGWISDLSFGGVYRIKVMAGATQAGDDVAKLVLYADGKKLKEYPVVNEPANLKPVIHSIKLEPGKHAFQVRFEKDFYDPKNADPKKRDRNLYVGDMFIEGPIDLDRDQLPNVHKRFVTAYPSEDTSVKAAATQVLQPFISRAFRRLVTAEQIAPYASLVELAVSRGERYEQGLQVALTAVLVSPQFLFRIEGSAEPDNPNKVVEVNHYQLASRLSYFIWSSTPDDELLALAYDGRLSKPEVLSGQVKRMLADPRSQGLVDGFASQWLNLRNLEDITPDPKVFPDFNDDLKVLMQRETELFFKTVVDDDLPVTTFLTGKFTWVNEKLASHYGIDGISGEVFQRVSLEDTQRAGVITQGSVLTLTSNPNRTSPVKRGKWIMENILGTAPPDPPADVPEIEAAKKSLPDASFREQLELHRESAVCASCHRTMDPLGFGFENFDAIGRWRAKDGEFDIDASGKLPEGGDFAGPMELIEILEKQKGQFADSLARKMLVFALGRGLEYYDDCVINEITAEMQKQDYRFSSLVLGIVTSDAFLHRRGEGKKK